MTTTTLAAAQAYRHAGLSIIPIARDGTKKPMLPRWKEFQSRLPTEEEITAWFATEAPPGIATVCGAVSGNLELLDFDQEADVIFPTWQAKVDTEVAGLFSKLTVTKTPRGGYHVRYRFAGVAQGNLKLARDEAKKTLIETRGQGGYCLAPGCPLECHETGRTYDHFAGPKLSQVQTITASERDVLFRLARGFDKAKKPARNAPTTPRTEASAVDRAKRYLAKIPAAVSGSGGHAQTFEAARAMVYGFDLGTEAGFAILLAEYNPRCQPPWTEIELRHKCQDADTTAFDKPRGYLRDKGTERPPGHLNGNGHHTKAPPADNDRQDHYENLLTDVGNGKRLIKRHGQDLRFCKPWRKWLCWTASHWRIDDTVRIEAKAKETILALFAETAQAVAALAKEMEECDTDEVPPELKKKVGNLKNLMKWLTASQFSNRMQAMILMAQSEHEIPILPETLDKDLWTLNCLNGTIDLVSGRLRPHRREDYSTKLCSVLFDPNAKCPTWDKFLARIMAGEDLVQYLARAVGYSMTGSVREQCLFFLHGTGANGKSTFLGALLGVLGGYAMQTISELLMVRNGESHPTERADLFGRRFVATIETENGRRMAEALLKQLTGGDRIRARRMREDFWEFDPTHKLWLAANHKPVIRGTDYAIWRRIRLIPFTVTIGDEEKDPDLPSKLAEEAPGILAWAVRGCLEWQRIGLADPDQVRAATAEYRAEQDVIRDFLAECCVTGPDYRARASELYGRYVNWCQHSGEKEMSKKKFGQELQAKGHESFPSNGIWYRQVAVRVQETEGWKD